MVNPHYRIENITMPKADYDHLLAIKDAATQLIRCKGRYHAELNYKALAKILGVRIAEVSGWTRRDISQPMLPESRVAGDDVFQYVSVLARWEGDQHPCVCNYIGGNRFQHADGTLEGEMGWGEKVYRCIEWMALPE